MERRSFLKWLGLAPAAPVAAKAAEHLVGTAKSLDVAPAQQPTQHDPTVVLHEEEVELIPDTNTIGSRIEFEHIKTRSFVHGRR